jgi:leucyl-tRNA synthetase
MRKTMNQYNPEEIEKKWQNKWQNTKAFEASANASKPKYYALVEFPYPSGDGLHVGHVRGYTAMDIIARKRRAEGFNVLYPMGWDAFGLPAENYAIKTGTAPSITTKENIEVYKKQIISLGLSFDWSREINTTDPEYYRWTQWLFLQFLKHDLAYKAKAVINWCPKDKIGLANEEVVAGCCERCGTAVEKREKEQWMLAITKYADRLDSDLDTVDYLPQIKLQQKNWIGRSEGVEISFKVLAGSLELSVTVFTTRPETIFGATYLVLAPEHKQVAEALANDEYGIENKKEIQKYIEISRNRTDIERTAEGKEKTGVELKGVKAINPATQEEIPVFVADYVLPHYGTGAIMAVPAHDKRDFEFAQKHNLPIKQVVENLKGETILPYIEEGIIINSDGFAWVNGLLSKDAAIKIIEEFEHLKIAKKKVTFKLRDWVFSRQRYWGEPIPVIHCDACGIVPVPEKDLPVTLPKIEQYLPTDNGESPLASIDSWVNVKCPNCSANAKRETDVMPNWAGSSWYFLRYADPHNSESFAGMEALKYWTPVDWYNGGMEHTTLHLLYSRFWNKFLFDQGLVPTSEPYAKRTSHGLILAEGGEKMSKSKGNVVNPDSIVKLYGADTLRVYEMFMGPFDQPVAWSTESIIGPRRFLDRIYRLGQVLVNNKKEVTGDSDLDSSVQKAVQKVSDDIEALRFNTAISTMMILLNEFEKTKEVSRNQFVTFLKLLSPFAPHMTEELWEMFGNSNSISKEPWPVVDASKIHNEISTITIQINGKMRAVMKVTPDQSEPAITELAKNMPEVGKWLDGKPVKRVIFLKGKMINFVV